MRQHWHLKPELVFLNHGSFGACPIPVLAEQRRWRERMEAEPVSFFARDLEGLLDTARSVLAGFVRCPPRDLVFVPNATTAVSAVLRSTALGPGDELLTTDHEYNACRNALEFVARNAGARVVVAAVPFPLRSAEQVVSTLMAAVSGRTRLALFDHVTSQTGLVLPVARLVAEMNARGVDCLVDGAHALGMLDLDVPAIGAAYYTANCHKWLCAPKGSAFLYVRPDRQSRVRPAVISHGANATRSDRSRFWLEFDWVGTVDPTAFLCVPGAIRFMESLMPGGWPAIRAHNRDLVLWARGLLCQALGCDLPCPEDMIGSLASIPLPDGAGPAPRSALYTDPLQDNLFARNVEAPVIPWPAFPKRLLRISAALYNTREDFLRLSQALAAALA